MKHTSDELPKAVRWLSDAVGEKLGRPAHCRKVRSKDEWYVYDPVFSFVQKGMNKASMGYRLGYRLNVEEGKLHFAIVHSPLIGKLFKRNLALSTLLEILRSTEDYRFWHTIYWSSKSDMRGETEINGYFEELLLKNLIDEIEEFDKIFGFVSDLFPDRRNTRKKGGRIPGSGNAFIVLLADRVGKTLGSEASVTKLVGLTWPLFLCLYPVKPIETRTAGLARSMRSKGIPKVCEFTSIKMPRRGTGISLLCRGEIQGAHIKPDSLGGSDKSDNGIWLCEYHHRMTEGKITGKRNSEIIEVKFISKT